jgi:energy-converting hydrogenase A subunit K
MMKEQDTLFLMALVGVGAIIMSVLAVFEQWIIVVPITLAVIFLAFLIFYQNRNRLIHISESLEKIALIVTLILFVISFIYLYRPA